PEIELVAGIADELGIVSLGGDAPSHEDQLLCQLGELRIDRNGERQIGHRAALVDCHFMRELVYLAKQEVNCILVCGLGRGLTLGQWWNHEGPVPPPLVPRARESYPAEPMLPDLGFFTTPHQGEHGPRHHRDILAAHNLEQAQRVRHFFVAPLISADHSNSEDFNLWRLNQQRERLHIAAAGPGAVLIDDYLLSLLGP